MRTILAAMIVAAGVGLLAASHGTAAPINGAALSPAAGASSLLREVDYYFRRHGRLCYRKCYREFFFGRRVCRTYC